jgi:hypothetical protein
MARGIEKFGEFVRRKRSTPSRRPSHSVKRKVAPNVDAMIASLVPPTSTICDNDS